MLFSRFSRCLLASLFVVALSFSSVDAMAFGSKDEKEKAVSKAGTQPKKGIASWYGPQFQGKKTSTGEIYDMNKLTCASNRYPLGTWLKVTNQLNGKSVIVRVNDRMHPRMTRIVDLSKAAAAKLSYVKSGLAKVLVENLGNLEPRIGL